MNSEDAIDDDSAKGYHHEFQGFGYFLVKAAEEIDLDLAIKLATSFDFSSAEIDKLECRTHNSLFCLRRMRQKGLIEPNNITKLIECLRSHKEDGIAQEINKHFRKIGHSNIVTCSGETRKMRHIQDFVPGEDCMIYVLKKMPILHAESQINKEVTFSQGQRQDQVDGGKRNSEEDQTKGADDSDSESEKDDENENTENKECHDDDDDDDDYDDDDGDDDDGNSCSDDEDTYDSTFLVVKEDLKPMQLHMRKHTESEIEINHAFKIKDYSQCEDTIVVGESSVLRKSCNDRFFRDRVTPEFVEKALNTHLQMKSANTAPTFDVHGVKHGPPSQIIPYLKAIVTNIYFHVDQYHNNKTHITLKDREFGTKLRVLINDAHVTSAGLMEGSIINLKHFKTYRSPNYTDNCLVSTKHSIIKNVKSKKLQDERDLLPLVGCYQVEGKLQEIDKSFKTYHACPESQCFATKVRELSSGKYKCPKCCQTFNECAQGAYLEVSIREEYEGSRPREHNAIIFKNSLLKILKDYWFLPQHHSHSSIWKSFDENFFGKEILVVIKPPIKLGNPVITSMKLP